MIERIAVKQLQDSLFKRKVIMLLGARQTGKTTLLKDLVSKTKNSLWLNGDEYDIHERFKKPSSSSLKALIGNSKLVVIDEAQKIENIGIGLKLLYDTYPEVQLIVTGSSAFELNNKTSEPLTGRKIEMHLFPLSTAEMVAHTSELEEQRNLAHRLVYGMYPEIVTKQGNEKEMLKFLADSYLFRDILMLDSIKKPEKLVSLLQALAFQIGAEVSYNELGNFVGLDSKTVESYINLLEKSFVIFRLNSLNRNLRNELKLSKKIYFYDNGVRNALISNFQILEGRQDIGKLWENFIVMERMKYNQYTKNYLNKYFWRTKDQQEIDYIEEQNGRLNAYEFKWGSMQKARFSKTFTNAYPIGETKVITGDNYMEFCV